MSPLAAAKHSRSGGHFLYHWAPNDDTEQTRKNLLVVSPLVALMGEQADDLTKRGIPAIALTSQTPNLEEALKSSGLNKFRVVLVSPEMAIGKSFHQNVLKSGPFQENNIGLIIDEVHAMDEWGTDDFRPAYSELATLLKRMPTGAPLMMGSATLPPILRSSVVHKLGISSHYVHLGFSNEKTNIALSVRILQHSLGSYADLLPLFTKDAAGNPNFPQTLIYKLNIQEHIRDGSLLGVSTTDALGMGINFPHIKRVIFYREPKTFLSYVQKAGRCVRLMSENGEVILFITRAAYAQHLANLEAEGEDGDDDSDPALGPDVPEVVEGEQMDRDAAVEEPDDGEHENVPAATQQRRFKRGTALSAFEVQDRLHLSRFIVTSQCRWKIWNGYFENEKKKSHFSRHGSQELDAATIAIPTCSLSMSYGKEVVAIIGDILKDYPDEAQQKRDEAQRERAFNQLIAAANKQRRERLKALFQECYEAVFNVTTGRTVTRGRGATKRMEPERRCQIFLTLPRRTKYPDYYLIINRPISMATIKSQMNAPRTGYSDLQSFVDDWKQMFANARTYNIDESQPFIDSIELEHIFNHTLQAGMQKYGLELDPQPATS
ncbi:p-loop containing nucleoside triphosphate hydrolase protein [Mycena sanguinolenta]|uniref:DNA 3'-5' helicase n=1 Tax=Mycena sanguinolenta TaxID=230812 RepID=A0A8H6ZB33_9AGAR|nr:p-loop containing nucleoside triphosphate hydrolase protein [Mycena sanguinolenta]